MRNIRFNLWLIFWGLMVTANAQQVASEDNRTPATVVWSEEYQEPSNTEIQKIVATEGGGFYALRLHQSGLVGGGKQKPIIEYYNSRMKLVRSRELDLEYKGKERFLKDVVMVDGRLWVLTYFYNEKHEKTYLFAQEVNKNTLNLAKDMVKIGEQDETNRERQDVFSLSQSRDSSKIVIFNRQPNSKDGQSFSIAVFDGDFNELWARDAKLPYGKNKFGVEDYQVDNKGNVYIMGIIYTEGANRKERRGKPTYQYDIVAYMKDSTIDVQEYKIGLKDKFVTDLTFRIADDGEIVCAGFYSEKDAKGMKGSCFFKINPRTKDMTSISTREFDFNFVTANLSERSKQQAKAATEKGDKDREPELFDYSLDKLIMRSDGGVILIAEQYYIEERLLNNNPYGTYGGLYGYNSWYNPYSSWYDPYGYRYNRSNRRADYYFNYNDIIVVNIQPDGEIAWATRIPKRQVSVNDGGTYSSYAMSIVADKLYFAYNENPKNLDPSRTKTVAETPDRYSIVTLAEVSRDGSLKRYPMFSNRDKGVVTRPKICRQVGRRDMAVYGENGRSYRFGVLSFD
ncbi:MAG: hypothetical protein JNL70_21215 [Saprospiraceae bacterium]|nr:hypothetical protein [Saprospiraceae bacterium]